MPVVGLGSLGGNILTKLHERGVTPCASVRIPKFTRVKHGLEIAVLPRYVPHIR
jgi:hypothetical protein